MAKEKVIEIKTGDAVKSIQDLKNNISGLKQALADLEIGSTEYKETLNALQENQAALRNAMYGTTASLQDVMNAATAANVAFDDNNKLVKEETLSYNELVRELAILKEQWRATTDESARADLGEKINNVNDRLKEMDASVGTYGRNVGNYVGSLQQFAQGFGAMGKGAQAVIAPIKGVTTGLKTMSATPVVAILGILASVLDTIIKELKSSEENTQAMTAAMAPLNAIGDAVTKVLQLLGKVVVGLVKGFTDLMQAIFGTNKATERRIQLAEKEAQLTKQARETTIANAEAERDIAELRAKAAEKEKYTASERLEFLQQAGQKEAEIAARAIQDARLQYEIIKAKNEITKSSKQELDKEAEAYAALVRAETAYYNTIRTINSGITSARREEARDARAAGKAREDARKAELQAYQNLLQQEIALLEAGSAERLAKQKELARREYEMAVQNAKDKIKNQETLQRTLLALQKKYNQDVQQAEREQQAALLHIRLQGLANTANQYAKGTRENLRALKDLRKEELETLHREEGESEADFNARRLAAQWAYYEAVRAFNEKVVDETTLSLREAYANAEHTQENTLAFEMNMAEARLNQIDILGKEAGETEQEFAIRRADAARAAAEATNAYLDYMEGQDLLKIENDLNTLEEGSLAYLEKAVELKQYEMDHLHQLEGESEEEFRARQLAAEKEYIAAKKALWQSGLDMMSQVASATSGILGSIADMYEANTEMSEEEAKKVKNLRIAGATIDMLQGAVTAYAGAQSLGVPMGPIIGAINAAAVVATGLANIAKIKNQNVSTSSSSTQTPAVVEAPSVTPEVNQVRTLTGASEEERLNKMAEDRRVYILSSDLEADRDHKKVQVEETTF